MLKKALVFLVTVFVLTLYSSSTSLAYEFNVTVQKKAGVGAKLTEKVNLLLKFSKSSKASYWRHLLDVRLAELKYVIETNDIDSVEETASRYSTYVGHYVNYLTKNTISSEKEIALSLFEAHQKVLSELRDKFEYDSGWWLSISHDINTINLLSEKVKSL